MYVVPSQEVGIALGFVTLFTWGVWGMSFKVCSEWYAVRSTRFMAEFSVCCCVWAFVAGSVFGDTLLWSDGEQDMQFFYNIVHGPTLLSLFYCLVAGLCIFIGILLLLVGVEHAGLAVAFPLTLSITVVGGTAVNYAVNPQGSAPWIVGGVSCAFVAILFAAAAHFSMMRVKQSALHATALEDDRGWYFDSQALRGALCCLTAGIFFSVWPTFEMYTTHQSDRVQPLPLSNYASFFLITLLGVLGILFVMLTERVTAYVADRRRSATSLDYSNVQMPSGEYGSFSQFDFAAREKGAGRGASPRDRGDALDEAAGAAKISYEARDGSGAVLPPVPPLSHRPAHEVCLRVLMPPAGALLYSSGTVANLIAADQTGFAISYFLAQASVVVTTLIGLTVWREFDGSPTSAKLYLALFFLFYGLAVACIIISN